MPFADEMIGEETAFLLAEILDAVTGGDELRQRRRGGPPLAPLALRQRVDLLSDELLSTVGGDYLALSRVVREARASEGFAGWMIWPVTEALAAAAVADGGSAVFDDALDMLAELTGLLTSEFAIRRLLRRDLGRVLSRALEWTTSEDHHLRRLASEGTRPYLPWAIRVPELVSAGGATVPILDGLYRDPSEYVRRSVANHLNDLSRDHAPLVVETGRRWTDSPDQHTAWVVRHGLRTLVKRGDRSALALQGYLDPVGVLDIDGPEVDRGVVAIGDGIGLRAEVRNVSTSAVRVVVDYVVHHFKANGTQTPKVFRLKSATLRPGEAWTVQRVHSFREISTRRYHPGPHAISLQVNGVSIGRATFTLTGPVEV